MNRVFLSLVIIAFSAFIVSAALGDPLGSVTSSYSLGEDIKGWVNISFEGDEANTIFSDSFDNSITLIDALNNGNYNFACNPSNCEDGYATSGSEQDEKVVLLSNEDFVGFQLNGANVRIDDLKLNFNSNAGASCSPQLSIDFLDDNSINWENPRFLEESCGSDLRSSCYSSFGEWASIDDNEFYCEQINLPKAPAFEIKSRLKAQDTSFQEGDLTAWIWNKDFVGECNLTAPSTSGSEVGCIVEYSNKKMEDHYVCIRLEPGAASNGYEIDYRTDGNFCGAPGTPSPATVHVSDYNIAAKAQKYDSVSNFQINESVYGKYNNLDSLVQALDNYISDEYQRDCSEGCVIPIKLSGATQDITINNIELDYTSDGAPGGTTKTKLIDLDKTPALITSELIKFDLEDLDFTVPNQEGAHTFTLSFGEQEIIEQDISVSNDRKLRILQVFPQVVAVAQPTTYVVFVDSEANETGLSYVWDFGEGSGELVTNVDRVKYAYSSIGNQTLSVRILDGGEELDSQDFDILAESPKEAIGETIDDYKERIQEVSTQVDGFSADYRTVLNQILDLQEVTTQLSVIETEYKQLLASSATEDEDYITIMQELVEFPVPVSIRTSRESSLPFVNDPSDVDFQEVRDLYFDDYIPGFEDEYQQALTNWFINNIDAKIKHEVISIFFMEGAIDILTEFEVEINPKSALGYDGYLIIREDKENLIFNGDYTLTDDFGVTGITVDLDNGGSFSFAVAEGIDVFDLPIYVSPPLDRLDVNIGGTNLPDDPGFRLGFFLFYFIILLIIALAIYIFLQQWYKYNYEKHLFAKQQDLYNLMAFIQNARNQGLSDSQIKDKLKKSKWSSEQINYVINKLDGKRVGMYEIPVFKWWEKRKLKKQMEKNKKPRRVI